MAFDRTYRGPMALREALTAPAKSTMGVSVRTVRRLMGFDSPNPNGWGDLGQLAGSQFINGARGVAFEWDTPERILNIVYFERDRAHVTRIVRVKMSEQPGRLEFGDKDGVRRGIGTIEANGSAWFFEDPHGRVAYAVATGAVYTRASSELFERQRFSSDGQSVMLEPPDQYQRQSG